MTAKSILITGASTGIGEACAVMLHDLGFQVFAGVRNRADGEALRQRTSQQLVPVLLDVTDAESIANAVIQVAAATSHGLWGLVNNAGIAIGGPLELLSLEDFRLQMEVNVIGQLAVTQAFIPLLRMQCGRIINMGSIAGRGVLPFMGPYSVSKFALRALNDSLRMELDTSGIRVSLIEPGSIRTPIWRKSLVFSAECESRYQRMMEGHYKQAMNQVQKAVERSERNSLDANVVAQAVLHALTAKKPKTRYGIGREIPRRILLDSLPNRVRDWLVLKYLGLK